MAVSLPIVFSQKKANMNLKEDKLYLFPPVVTSSDFVAANKIECHLKGQEKVLNASLMF